jgi:hypothetical protein
MKVKAFLKRNPNSNTRQVYDHINSTLRQGTTMNQLTNVLAKDPDIKRTGSERVGSTIAGGSYAVGRWRLQED